MTVPVDISYYVALVDAQDEAAKIAARHERHGNKVQTFAHGPAWHRTDNPTGFRAYVTMKRYKVKVFHATNANGRSCYMGRKAYEIYIETGKLLRAGQDLHTTQIANVTGASQGYVTKVLQFLHRFHFIVVSEVIRGRWGRIKATIATAVRQSFLHPRRVSVYGGMINAAALAKAGFEAYVATLKDGDLYVPASQRA